MRKEHILLIGIIVILLGGLIYSISGFFVNSDKINIPAGSDKLKKKNSESTVTVDLTPKFENGKLYVDIEINTHTVDLSQYDLKDIVALEFEGKSIKPVSAPKLSGHHNSVQLIFDVGKELSNFKIIVKDLPDIQERVFEWP